MNSPHLVRKLQNAWRQLSRPRKILAGCIIISCIVSGWFTLHLIIPDEYDIPPHIRLRLSITEEVVYSNGTVSFTVICIVESYKNYPIPEGDLYQIRNAFICVENDLIDFNSTFGEIKDTSEISVIEGDFSLSANEEVSLTFQTTFDLHNFSHIYVGVLANGPTGVNRWDRYTSISIILLGLDDEGFTINASEIVIVKDDSFPIDPNWMPASTDINNKIMAIVPPAGIAIVALIITMIVVGTVYHKRIY